jgi:hypothetical protein
LIGDDGLSKVRRKTLAPDEELTPVAESIHELALNFCTFPALCIKRTKGVPRRFNTVLLRFGMVYRLQDKTVDSVLRLLHRECMNGRQEGLGV